MMYGRSAKIHEDKRTVGIDLKSWDLSEEAGVIFDIKVRVDGGMEGERGVGIF